MGIPAPPDVLVRLPAAMSEPYVMQWYPTDGGYASLAVHAFDPLAGTLDGINSAGLVVSILADEEALAMLGPLLEPHFGARGAVGLHELQMMRWLLDTCDSADQARQALLAVK
jgi:penicillin V acylase-like amidase (Ntn superfamily)